MRQHLIGAVLATAVVLGGQSILDSPDSPPYEAVEAALQADEGFRAHPYRDSRGVLTVGYGTNLDQGLTRFEAAHLLRSRLDHNGLELGARWPPFRMMPPEIQGALVEMAYQLGPAGVAGDPRVLASGDCDKPRAERPHGCGFHDMLAALSSRDYETAAREALASRWARETPARAKRVAAAFRGP